MDELVEDDYLFICSSLYPTISKELLSKLIHFNNRLYEDTMLCSKFGQDGSPWEFNLRDIIRSCQIIESEISFFHPPYFKHGLLKYELLT